MPRNWVLAMYVIISLMQAGSMSKGRVINPLSLNDHFNDGTFELENAE
jgi:hypothetical protein